MRNFDEPGRNPHLHPFPHNIYTKTAYIIPEHLKLQIVEDEQVNGLHPQEIAHKYGINLQRVEAILKLSAIEKTFQPKVCLDTLLRELFDLIVMKLHFYIYSISL